MYLINKNKRLEKDNDEKKKNSNSYLKELLLKQIENNNENIKRNNEKISKNNDIKEEKALKNSLKNETLINDVVSMINDDITTEEIMKYIKNNYNTIDLKEKYYEMKEKIRKECLKNINNLENIKLNEIISKFKEDIKNLGLYKKLTENKIEYPSCNKNGILNCLKEEMKDTFKNIILKIKLMNYQIIKQIKI